MGLLPLCKVVCDLLLNDRIKGERELLISSWGHRRDHRTELELQTKVRNHGVGPY